MKERRGLFAVALILTVFVVGEARGGPVDPGGFAAPFRWEAIGVDVPDESERPAGDRAASPIVAPLGDGTGTTGAGEAVQVPEPAAMGLFGIGLTGLIALRRFRRLMFS